MKKVLLLCLTALMCCVTGAWALSGSGSQSDPYILQDGDQFTVNGGTMYAEFTAPENGVLRIHQAYYQNCQVAIKEKGSSTDPVAGEWIVGSQMYYEFEVAGGKTYELSNQVEFPAFEVKMEVEFFNPEDLNALEQALRLKEQNPGSTVGVLTMGPPRAAEIIRQGLYRGADTGWLLTDRLFAGADTLATSYALATAIKHIGGADIIIGGRQAIDGDTAQVGPQVAQKLGLSQVTYAEEILKCEDGKLTIRRHIDGGVETVEAPMPIVITVNGSAAPCRPCNAKLVMKYKYATVPLERTAGMPYAEMYETRPYLTLNQWSVADIDGDPQQCGLAGSPTKVKAVKNIVFQAKESKTLTGSDADVEGMIKELLEEKIIG